MREELGNYRSVLLAPLIVAFFVSVPSTWAGDGELDPSFGSRGAVLADFAGKDDYAGGLAIQPDGKIVVAGQSGVYPLFHSALARFEVDGTLDASFGDGGKVVAALDAGGDQLSAVAVQRDGKLVAAGALIHDNFQVAFLLARFQADGSLDPAFGDSGSVVETFGDQSAAASAIVVQPDGKIVVVGFSGAGPYSELNDFAIARYDRDGSLDPSFGYGGKTLTHFPGVYNTGSRATSAVLQTDGKLLVAGTYKNEGTPREFAMARYLSNGSLDPTFGSQGRLTTSLGGADALALGIQLQWDGSIVLAGTFETAHHDHDFALVSYGPNGALDTSFGNGGRVIDDLFDGSDDIAYDLALQVDGKLIATGRTGQYPNFEFAVARYDWNGSRDPSFGQGGRVATGFGGFSAQAYASAMQADGNIVVTGYSINTSIDLVVARYLATSGPGYRKR
jgi:uncharacterized delta-60 repeat protein